jgi:hypothetical protein
MPREGIEPPLAADDRAQPIVTTTHVHGLGREHNSYAARQCWHAFARSAANNSATSEDRLRARFDSKTTVGTISNRSTSVAPARTSCWRIRNVHRKKLHTWRRSHRDQLGLQRTARKLECLQIHAVPARERGLPQPGFLPLQYDLPATVACCAALPSGISDAPLALSATVCRASIVRRVPTNGLRAIQMRRLSQYQSRNRALH